MGAKPLNGFPNRRSKNMYEYDRRPGARVSKLWRTLSARGEFVRDHVRKVLALERVEGLDFWS